MKSTLQDKIIVYGGSGLVGSRIVQMLSPFYHIIAPSRSEIDITNKRAVEFHINSHSPDFIIYTAGLTSVDACEKNPEEAAALNSKVPEYIAKRAALLNIPVIYFSTNAVFDGKNDKHPYKENDKPNPISVYGKTKLQGELNMLYSSNHNIVIRLINVYSSFFEKKSDSARKVLDNMITGNKVYGITDQIINPIFVDDIIASLKIVLKKNIRGIYHLGATDYVTNYEFVKKIAYNFHLDDSLILPISLQEFFKDAAANRANYCWLDVKKFTKEFGDNILHTVDEGIVLFKQKLEERQTKIYKFN